MTAKERVPESETMQLGEEMFLSATVRAAKQFVKITEQSQLLNIETMSAARPNVDYKVQRRTAHLYSNQSEQRHTAHDQAWPFLSVKIQSQDLALKIGSKY